MTIAHSCIRLLELQTFYSSNATGFVFRIEWKQFFV